MMTNSKISWLGVSVMAFAVFLLAVAIPYGVNAPTNIDILVLSPKFWPIIITGALAMLGLLMIMERIFYKSSAADGTPDDNGETDATGEDTSASWIRLLGMAGLMGALILAIPKVGMVWASMICFVLFALLVRSPRLVASLIVAVILPLVLYGFFNHIAGVAIPQGEFVRLP